METSDVFFSSVIQEILMYSFGFVAVRGIAWIIYFATIDQA